MRLLCPWRGKTAVGVTVVVEINSQASHISLTIATYPTFRKSQKRFVFASVAKQESLAKCKPATTALVLTTRGFCAVDTQNGLLALDATVVATVACTNNSYLLEFRHDQKASWQW